MDSSVDSGAWQCHPTTHARHEVFVCMQRTILFTLISLVAALCSNPLKADSSDYHNMVFSSHVIAINDALESKTRLQPVTMNNQHSSSMIPIRINIASEEELLHLPGIGKTRARAIIDERNQHGPFINLLDLERVTGIGSATANRLKNMISFER